MSMGKYRKPRTFECSKFLALRYAAEERKGVTIP
jgi:hypothetical protein